MDDQRPSFFRNLLELRALQISDNSPRTDYLIAFLDALAARLDGKMTAVTVKAMSNAYFRILERQPNIREVFQLGNHIVWVSPSGTALIIDQGDGREELPDAEIDRLFVAKKS